jgi:tripartite-type tricarboxylate transporter receptor subunit TctC
MVNIEYLRLTVRLVNMDRVEGGAMIAKHQYSALLGLCLILLNASVAAQSGGAWYPAKPVRIIVPFAPGGGTDVTARIVSQSLTEKLGQPVLIEHRPGAGTRIGTELAAKAAPDGHTILIVAAPHVINPVLYRGVKYHPVRDFAAVSLAVTFPFVLAVHPDLPVRSVKELVAQARTSARALTYASSGTGTTNHLAGELFKRMAGIELTHVPFKGGGPALNDVMGGHVALIFGTVLETLPQVRSGKLRGLAVSSAARAIFAPELPAVAEELPGYDVTGWYAFLAPAGTPRSVVGRLNEEITRILAAPETRERFLAMGAEPAPTSPEQAQQFIGQEFARWEKVIGEARITAE